MGCHTMLTHCCGLKRIKYFKTCYLCGGNSNSASSHCYFPKKQHASSCFTASELSSFIHNDSMVQFLLTSCISGKLIWEMTALLGFIPQLILNQSKSLNCLRQYLNKTNLRQNIKKRFIDPITPLCLVTIKHLCPYQTST